MYGAKLGLEGDTEGEDAQERVPPGLIFLGALSPLCLPPFVPDLSPGSFQEVTSFYIFVLVESFERADGGLAHAKAVASLRSTLFASTSEAR